MIQCYHSSPSIWRCWTGQPITFSLVCFWFCCFLGFVCVLCFVWRFLCFFLDCDGSLDYVSVLASSSFWGFRRTACVNALISQVTFLQHAIERVKRPGGSQEALDRKKTTRNDDPQISQPDFRFASRENSENNTKRGRSHTKQYHTNPWGLPPDTIGSCPPSPKICKKRRKSLWEAKQLFFPSNAR